jgi:D-lactate dehydrogenase (cytochrome)
MKEVEAAGFVQDESRLSGHADRVLVAHSEADIVAVLAEAQETGIPVTAQGGLTGITGSAVPQGGTVLRLQEMCGVKGLQSEAGGFVLRVEPGCTLDGIRRMLEAPGKWDVSEWTEASRMAWKSLCEAPLHMFPPDLTETGATLGGVVSTNGSGARSYRYGSARQHVAGLRVVLPGGDVLALARGREQAAGLTFSLRGLSGKRYAGVLPSYLMPAVKHAAGLYARPDMDLIDLFIGSEGVLGVISEVEIRLIPRPLDASGLTVFLPSEVAALDFVEQVRALDADIQAIEYFSSQALHLLRDARADGPVDIPVLKATWHTAIYVECCRMTDIWEKLCALLVANGGDPEDTWFADGYEEIETIKGIRHSVPERINQWIAEQRKVYPDVTKLGTDLAVPDGRLREVMSMYHHDLQAHGLTYAIFGHIGDNHVHVNILPRDTDEWKTGKALYAQWAVRVVAMGGTVSAEHGIGKIKVQMLHAQFGSDGIGAMRAVKSVFDPGYLLNRGTLFDYVPANDK